MNIQYGFVKFTSTLYRQENQLFGNKGDIVMFSRHGDEIIIRVLNENITHNLLHDTMPADSFKKYFKLVNNFYLLCTQNLDDEYFKFEKDIVYQFKGGVFRSLFSEQPLKSDKNSLLIGEKWKTTIFFMSGKWIFDLKIKVIDRNDALEREKAFELKTDSEKFGI